MAKNEVAKSTDVLANDYRALAVPAEKLTSFLMENVGSQGLTPFDLDKIKVPSGGGIAWEVPTLKGPESLPVIEGIILHFKDVRGYWPEKGSSGNPPECQSTDGLVGIGKPGGDCAKCPLAQFGSGRDDKGQPSKGQACKQMRMMLFLRQADMLPMLISLPPTSIKGMKQYFLRLVQNGYPFYGVTTQLRLEKQKNAGGNPYSTATPAMGRELQPDEFQKVQVIGQAMKALFSRTTVVDADGVHE